MESVSYKLLINDHCNYAISGLTLYDAPYCCFLVKTYEESEPIHGGLHNLDSFRDSILILRNYEDIEKIKKTEKIKKCTDIVIDCIKKPEINFDIFTNVSYVYIRVAPDTYSWAHTFIEELPKSIVTVKIDIQTMQLDSRILFPCHIEKIIINIHYIDCLGEHFFDRLPVCLKKIKINKKAYQFIISHKISKILKNAPPLLEEIILNDILYKNMLVNYVEKIREDLSAHCEKPLFFKKLDVEGVKIDF